jgi:hypothetical protein
MRIVNDSRLHKQTVHNYLRLTLSLMASISLACFFVSISSDDVNIDLSCVLDEDTGDI